MSNERLFPQRGSDRESVRERLLEFKGRDISEALGRLNVYCHKGSEELDQLRRDAYGIFAHSNAFLAGYMDGMGTMQAEVLQMALEILNGPVESCAFITTGGTESIFCAMHTAREWAKVERPVPGRPQVMLPYSGHVAFDKACQFLEMDIVRIPVRDDYRADVAAMEAAITPNTIAIVGSAPNWPYGTIDPIADIAAVAQRHHLWMHVDACVGGFINPWLERLGYDIPLFDFRVPGVMSMSADLHKHGYASKPCSTVLYRSRAVEPYHFVEVDDWPDGPYKTAGFVGSRPAASVATAWSVMKYLGESGYVALTRECMEVRQKLVEGIENIEDLKCLQNDSTMIYFRSETLDMPTLIGGMVEKGYFPFGVFNPMMLQLIPEPVPDEMIDTYLAALKEVASGVREGTVTSTALARYA
ncbi:aminotransferase class V-fold PLP-dependent enzyme [Microbulbifer taiwanensis]|uniref:Aminotransferase class V-fold PLP-dependent enzyme n=1 Tax=Microbulbifer taiwanensis TaxID=986746 RepID=A0ABW1YJU2_9GAMM|nr:aminotransferase class V-fold PLP-dependent enzyme [Microbulbifer taiwanensis]